MMRVLLLLAAMISFSYGCARTSPPDPQPSSSSKQNQPSRSAAPEILDQMDRRAPLPLLPMMAHHQKQNMRDHLAAVQEIVAALAMDQFAEVERAAKRLGFSEQMGQMCTHMGAGAPGFSERAIAFHRTADSVAVAARANDKQRVLTELGATLEACTSCHAAWKQQVVDDVTWQKLASGVSRKH